MKFTPYRTLDHLKTRKHLDAYVQERIRLATEDAMTRSKRWQPYARVLGYAALILLGMWLAGLMAGCATPPAARMHVVMTGNPPQYFSGIVTYRNNRVQRLMVGSDRFLSCQEALHDTTPSLEKGLTDAPEGWAAKGICIPVPTLDVSDLVPRSLF